MLKQDLIYWRLPGLFYQNQLSAVFLNFILTDKEFKQAGNNNKNYAIMKETSSSQNILMKKELRLTNYKFNL